MVKELIDKLREVAGYTPPICHYEKGNPGPVYCKPFEQFQKLMWLAAVALENAEPVRHGRWEKRDGKTWCSLCGTSNKAYEPPYCPHCGKPMDGGVSDEG